MNCLIIGLGNIGKRHAYNLSKLKHDVYYYDKYVNEINKYKKILSLKKDNLKKIDLFVISVPSNQQLTYLEKVIRYNKKILIEKPVALNNKKLNDFLFKFKDYKLKENIFIGYQRFYWSGYDFIKSTIKENIYGKSKIVNINFSQNFQFYRPSYANTYYKKKSTGGGVVIDALSHYVSIITILYGEFKKLKSLTSRLQLKNVSVEDTAFIIFKTSTIYGSIIGNQFQSGKNDIIEIIFEKARLLADINDSSIKIFSGEKSIRKIKFKENNWDKIYFNLINEFAKKNSKPKFNIYDAYRTLLNLNKI